MSDIITITIPGMEDIELMMALVYITRDAIAHTEAFPRIETTEECMVCYDTDFEGVTTQTLYPCGHHSHSECIESWLAINRTCPLCRAAIPSGQPTRTLMVDPEEVHETLRELILRHTPVTPRTSERFHPKIQLSIGYTQEIIRRFATVRRDTVGCQLCQTKNRRRIKVLPCCGGRAHIGCLKEIFVCGSQCPFCLLDPRLVPSYWLPLGAPPEPYPSDRLYHADPETGLRFAFDRDGRTSNRNVRVSQTGPETLTLEIPHAKPLRRTLPKLSVDRKVFLLVAHLEHDLLSGLEEPECMHPDYHLQTDGYCKHCRYGNSSAIRLRNMGISDGEIVDALSSLVRRDLSC